MTGPRLFDDAKKLSIGGCSHPTQGTDADASDRANKVRQSALWAAYGDALGWISELTTEKGLKRRTRGASLDKPIEWKRRIGGRTGITVTLPQGCYSDDSQLRLATSRSIRSNGFDVEAFSKVELPVWLSYALGGGKSTSAAATNLAKPRVQWFANTFKGWTNSGGNGAAMRIQPHVWAANAPDDPETFLLDVIRNAICTHSHPNGLMGAVIHALALAHAMATHHHPSPDDLMAATDIAKDLLDVVQGDAQVGQYWRSAFERDSGSFGDAWTRAVDDCQEAIRIAADTSDKIGAERYTAIVDRLMLRNPARRGSGVLTAVAAVGLIWCEAQPESALSVAANEIGTDTDTIATMAGAILGIVAEKEPPVEVLDADLFRSEADRLAKIARGKTPRGYGYPDLLRWSAPRARADALVRLDGGGLHVYGLGDAKAVSEPIPSPRDDFAWQWVKLELGQTLLIKRRKHLPRKRSEASSLSVKQSEGLAPPTAGGRHQVGRDLPNQDELSSSAVTPSQALLKDELEQSDSRPDIQAMINHLEKHKYEDRVVGQVIRRVVNKCTDGQIGAFLAVVIDRLREPSRS